MARLTFPPPEGAKHDGKLEDADTGRPAQVGGGLGMTMSEDDAGVLPATMGGNRRL